MRSTMENKQTKTQKIKGFILNFLLGLSILIVLLAVVNMVFFKSEDAYLFGYKPYFVASESMEPAFMKYGFVLIHKGDYDDIKEGDVIAFKAYQINGRASLHRVLDVTPDGILTKGDAVKIADGQLVDRSNFLGHEVWHTNLTAVLYMALQTPQGVFYIIILPCLLIVFLTVIVRVMKKMSGKNC